MGSVRGAFVVQVDEIRQATEGKLGGRIEHVLTGEALEFHTPAALIAFITRMVGIHGEPAATKRSSPPRR